MNMFERFQERYSVFVIIGILLLVEIFFRIVRTYQKNKMEALMKKELITQDNEKYISYYQKMQILYVVRAGLVTVFLVALLSGQFPGLGGFFAIAAGAIVFVFGTFIQSIVTYFNLLTLLSVGDTIEVGNQYKGEVIKIRPLYLIIAGRNENGDHTGQLIHIPNHVVRMNNVSLVDLSQRSYQKEIITVPYTVSMFRCSFETFIRSIFGFLDHYLPITTIHEGEHFQTYIGHRYKWGIAYNENGTPVITIEFICLLKEAHTKQYEIIRFIEHLKTTGGDEEHDMSGNQNPKKSEEESIAEWHHKKLTTFE